NPLGGTGTTVASGGNGNFTGQVYAIDKTAPAISLTTPANGSSTNDTTPTFSGTAGTAPGDSATVTVRVYAGATATGPPVQILTATRDGTTGAFTVDASPALADGTYTAQASQSDAAGTTGTSTPVTFTVDTVAPTITAVRVYWGSGSQSFDIKTLRLVG